MITSAKPEVIRKLSVDDALRVDASAGKLPLVAVDEKGRVAGSIVVPEQDDLLGCIKRGTAYVATVVSLEGGACIVHISAKDA